MMIRIGSLGDVEYDYSDLPNTLQDANYDPNFDFGYEWWKLHQQPVDYVYSDTSGYKLPDTGSQTSVGSQTSAGAQSPLTGQKTPGTGAQPPLTGQKMPSITQRPPAQQSSSSGGMLMLLGAVGLGLYLALS